MLAYKHFNDDTGKMEAAGPWWPFYSKHYNAYGKKLCAYGKIILAVSLLVTAYYFTSPI